MHARVPPQSRRWARNGSGFGVALRQPAVVAAVTLAGWDEPPDPAPRWHANRPPRDARDHCWRCDYLYPQAGATLRPHLWRISGAVAERDDVTLAGVASIAHTPFSPRSASSTTRIMASLSSAQTQSSAPWRTTRCSPRSSRDGRCRIRFILVRGHRLRSWLCISSCAFHHCISPPPVLFRPALLVL